MGASDDTGTWSGAAGVCGGATGVSGGAVGLLATTPRRVALSPPETCIFHPFAQAAFIVSCGSMGVSPGSGFRFPVKCAPTDMPCPLTSPSDYAPTAHTPKYIKFHVLFTERPHRPHPTHVGSMRVSPGSGTRRCHTSGHPGARTITT